MDLFSNEYIAHHGILGQKWGKRNGPPYPLSESKHSPAEKAAAAKVRRSSKFFVDDEDAFDAALQTKGSPPNSKKSIAKKVAVGAAIAVGVIGVGLLATSAMRTQNANLGQQVTSAVLNGSGGTFVSSLGVDVADKTALRLAVKELEEKNSALYNVNQRVSDETISGFTADEKYAVTSYTKETGIYNYKGMNNILRGVASKISSYSLLDKKILKFLNRECASALKKSSLKETMLTYRGVSNSTLEKLLGGPLSSFSASDLEGFEFTEKGFGSSSIKKSKALEFVSYQSGGKGGVILKTITPAGSQALCVESISAVPSEKELLTQNNSRYRIHDAVFTNGVLTELLIELIDSSSVC